MANALLRQRIEPLAPTSPFEGAGIYAIYYTGDFPAYARVADRNRDGAFQLPIYVGKADPKGGRRGGDFDAPHGRALWDRLADHAKSIAQATNLNSEDFACRYLAVDDVWIRMAERMLISWHLPVWNLVVDGFGNHDPGGRRATQYRSPWDVLHPGRCWANKLGDSGVLPEAIVGRVEAHLAERERLELEQAQAAEAAAHGDAG